MPDPADTIEWEARDVEVPTARAFLILFVALGVAVLLSNVLAPPKLEAKEMIPAVTTLFGLFSMAAIATGFFTPRRYSLSPEGLVTRHSRDRRVPWDELGRARARRDGVVFGGLTFWSPHIVFPKEPAVRVAILAALRTHLPKGLVE